MIDLNQQVAERLDPSALHFKSISVEGFKVIKAFENTFKHHNIIRGMNGVGKTTLLHLLAGIAGGDRATDLIADQKVGRFEVVLGAGNEEYRFTTTKVFDREAIQAFKSTLPEGKRVNYALTEYYYERFQEGRCDYATFEEQMRYFFERTKLTPRVFIKPGEGARIDPGSGVKNAIRLIMLASMRGGPLLLDHPEMSLDSRNKALLSAMVLSGDKQTISVTHATEWGTRVEKNIEMKI